MPAAFDTTPFGRPSHAAFDDNDDHGRLFVSPRSDVFPPFAAEAPAAEVEEGFTPIFNGKDLTGWDGKFANWYVADGAITGENSPQRPCTKCNYLFWRGGKPADFELRCLYRVSSRGNSGIQFRSRELPDFDVAGYQADIDGRPRVHRHALRLQRPAHDRLARPEGRDRRERQARSHRLRRSGRVAETHQARTIGTTYRIIARGPEITLIINGAVMSRTIDREKGKAARDRARCAPTSRRPADEGAVQEHSHPELSVGRFPRASTERQSNEAQCINRRRFLGAASAAAAGVSAAVPDSLPRARRAGPAGRKRDRQRGCDRLRQSRDGVANTCREVPMIRVVAACDCEFPARSDLSRNFPAAKSGAPTRTSAK